jgi:uncharacterized protein
LIEIKNIGHFCRTDSRGHIINDSSINAIKPEFKYIIDAVIETYQSYLGEHLHSVYIRGSIPRGLGIDNVSDLDTIAITNKNIDAIDLNWVDKAEQALNENFKAVDGVELSFYFIENILETTNFSIIPFMIKTHSICVYGKDISVFLPNYKADKTLANEHLVNLRSQIQQAKEELTGNEDVEDVLDCCRWIMKIIVRAGLALVLVEENKYTRDLYPAYKLFSEHFPSKESEMKQALEYAVNPISNSEVIINFLNELGEWMISITEKWLQVYNPNMERNMKI